MIFHKIAFGILYTFFMLLTYLPRYMFVEDSMNGSNSLNGLDPTLLLAIFYFIIVLVSSYLSIFNRHYWLFVLPLMAGIFDIIIPFVPFVPTVLMLAGLLTGLIISKKQKQD